METNTAIKNKDEKKNKIEEKAARYSKHLDKAFGSIAPSKPDSQEIKELKETIAASEIIYIDFRDIKCNENIRRDVTIDSDFEKLKLSIKQNGLLQNLIVEFRQLNYEKYDLVLVSGHRRLTALKQLEKEGFYSESGTEVPAQITMQNQHGRDSRTSIALSENLLRKNLHFIEVAETYKKLLAEGLSIEDISKKFAKNTKTVKRFLKIADWSEKIKHTILTNPEVFTLSSLWNDFVVSSKKDHLMASILTRRLKKIKTLEKEKPSVEKSPAVKSKVQEKRVFKMEAFFKEKRYSTSIQSKVRETLEHLGLI